MTVVCGGGVQLGQEEVEIGNLGCSSLALSQFISLFETFFSINLLNT